MKALIKLQQAFAADLWGDELHQLEGLILDDELSAARRFNVYRNNFRISLTDALAAIYPVVERLVGCEFFGFLADRYIRTHPSHSGNLHHLGSSLADFLGRFHPAAKLTYLPDIARLEWAYHEVFHAAAAESFDPKGLETISAEHFEKLHFDRGPACRLINSDYPIFRIWQTNQEDYTGDEQINLDAGPEAVLVVRPALEVEFRRLGPAEFAFVKTLYSGHSLGEAVNASLKLSSNFDLQTILGRHLESGALLTAVK